MYFQIMEQIKQLIAVGDWVEGQEIPSIRQLAVDLGVSVITVKRAYLELEHEGVIVTHHGKGSHVALNTDLKTRIREQELEEHLERAVRIGVQIGLGPADMETRLRAATERVAAGKEEYV
jgi:GntR family transcriptional regulator